MMNPWKRKRMMVAHAFTVPITVFAILSCFLFTLFTPPLPFSPMHTVSGQVIPGPVIHIPAIDVDTSPIGSGIGTTSFDVPNDSDSSITINVSAQVPGFRVELVGRSFDIGPMDRATIPLTIVSNVSGLPLEIEGLVSILVTHVNGEPSSSHAGEYTGFVVRTQAYSQPVIHFPSGFQEIGPMEHHEIPIDIMNAGNVRERFRLNMVDSGKPETNGIEAELTNATTRELDPGETQTILLKVSTPDRTGIFDDYHTVEVVASRTNGNESVTGTIVIHVRGISIPWMDTGAVIVLFVLGLWGWRSITGGKHGEEGGGRQADVKESRVTNKELEGAGGNEGRVEERVEQGEKEQEGAGGNETRVEERVEQGEKEQEGAGGNERRVEEIREQGEGEGGGGGGERRKTGGEGGTGREGIGMNRGKQRKSGG